MIAFVRGNFVQKSPARVIVDVNGVGYDLQISLNTYDFISQKDSGLLYTYLHITENAQTLYGFADMKEKEMFLHLISISGVGAATARMMLSSMKPPEIAKFIASGSVSDLVRIKGIGKKTAEMLVVGLRDKLAGFTSELNSLTHATNPQSTDAITALVALGIGKPVAEKAVNKVLQDSSETTLQEIIKQALKNL